MRAPDSALVVIHRDRDLLVVEKPSGLATTSPQGGDCLARRVAALDPGAERCHPSSRLDTDVTGVVVFARSSRGIDLVMRAREEGRYARRYVGLALPATEPASETTNPETARWRWDIGIDPRDPRKRRALEPGEHAERQQHAETDARVLARSALAVSLLLRPITGRTHQLRVHATRAGMPLLGDVAYGGPRRLVSSDGRVLGCPRVALHCLVVVLPGGDGSLRTFHAPLAPDLVALAQGAGLPPLDVEGIAEEARRSL